MAIKVTRKDQGEANENIIRRFNRKVLQSGIMPLKKSQLRFSKPISKRERRLKAIIREALKAEKTEAVDLMRQKILDNKVKGVIYDCFIWFSRLRQGHSR